jgi:hypothetical protein
VIKGYDGRRRWGQIEKGFDQYTVRRKRDGVILASGDIKWHEATYDENDYVIGMK